jgi:hypothetical protein
MTPGHSKFVAGKAMFDPKSGAFIAGHWEEGESGRIFVGKNVDGAIKWGVMNYSSAEKGGERHTVSDFTAVSHENIPTNGIEMTAAFDSHTGRQLNLVGKGGTDVHIKDNYVEEHRRSIDVDRGFLQMPGSDPSHMTDGQRGVLALEEGVKQGMDAVRDLAFGKRNFESLIGGNGGGGGEGASRSPSPSGPRGETDRITEALQREVQDWQRRNGRGEGNGNRGRGRRRR